MLKKKKRLIFIGAGIVIAGIIIAFLAMRYLPVHKFMKRPSSGDMDFIGKQQSEDRPPFTLYLDFEIDSTASVPGDLYKGIAHSGSFSSKTFGKNTFSVSFEKKVGDIHARNLKKVALSAWVYVMPGKHDPEGALVFTITNTVGVNTCWKGITLRGEYIPKGEWFKISGSFDLDDVLIRDDDKVQVYFWNNSSADILTDDFYVVFGAPEERRGDSTRVDMTRGGYRAGFNIAPYPSVFLQREEIGNSGSVYLVQRDESKEGELVPADQVIGGFFAAPRGSRESMLVIKKDGTPEMYQYCPELSGFRKISLSMPPDLGAMLPGSSLIAGAFIPGGSDQVLVISDKKICLAGFEKVSGVCSPKSVSITATVLWMSDHPVINGIGITPEQILAADVNGDQRDELLITRKGGAWELMAFDERRNDGGSWSQLASGDEFKVREWDPLLFDVKISAGKFLRNSGKDLILTVYIDKNKHISRYSIHQYNASEKKFVARFEGWQGNPGITIGVDTLKAGDSYFSGPFQKGDVHGIMKYNRDWRYELKMLEFNDTAFRMMASVDFTGYERDFNPKFYEALKIVPGFWIYPDQLSLLVIARNCKHKANTGTGCTEYENLQYLPNTIQIYSLKK